MSINFKNYNTMKKILFIFGLICMVAYSCSLDTSRGEVPGTEQQLSLQGWQRVVDSGKDSIKAVMIRQYIRNNITKEGPHPFDFEMDVNRPDLMDVYDFPVYTIDTAIWAAQPNLTLDQYLRLDETMACFYIIWQGRPVYRLLAQYADGIWSPKMNSMGVGYKDPHPEGAFVLDAIENKYQIIGVYVPYHGGMVCVYVFKDGKWTRIDPGLRHDEDVVQDLRKGFNGYIMRKNRVRTEQTGQIPEIDLR